MNEFTKVTTYVRSIKNQGIDLNQMQFSNINREDLLKARTSLCKIHEVLPDLLSYGNLEEAKLNEEEKEKVIKL
jgi:hypothetical protein